MDSQQITSSRTQRYAKTNKKTTNDKPKKTPKAKKGVTAIIVLSVVVCFIIGTVIGYAIVGDGNALDVFRLETWVHLYNLIFG